MFGVGRHGACDIAGVQKGGALETDVDEGRLHARQDPRYATLVEIAHQAAPAGALDVEFLRDAVFDQRGARLARRDIDQYLAHQRGSARRSMVCQRGTPAASSSAAVSNSGRPITPE